MPHPGGVREIDLVNLHDWIDELSDVLDVETEVDEGLVLDLARTAAHNVQRTAAPITTYLLGFAAGAGNANPEEVERLAARAQQLAESWDRPADAPDPDAPCPVRFTTTQPTQALGLLNSAFLNEQAGVFAASVAKEAGADPAARVRAVLRRVTQRAPTEAEVGRGVKFLAAMTGGEKLSEAEALRRFCLLALNLNEFVYVD